MTVQPNEQGDNQSRNRHSVIIDYLKTAPGVLQGAGVLLAALTGLLALFLR